FGDVPVRYRARVEGPTHYNTEFVIVEPVRKTLPPHPVHDGEERHRCRNDSNDGQHGTYYGHVGPVVMVFVVNTEKLLLLGPTKLFVALKIQIPELQLSDTLNFPRESCAVVNTPPTHPTALALV